MERQLKERRYRNKRRVIIFLSVLTLALLYAFKNASFLIRAMSTVGFFSVFYLIDHMFDLDFKERHYFFVVIIAVSGFLLSPLYFIHPQYDKIQHFILPIMGCSIIFHMVDRLELEKKWKLVFVFFIMVGFLSIFEVGEYLLDYFFDLKLQGVFLKNLQDLGGEFNIILDRIDDTMIDITLGILGSGMYVLSLYFWKKN